MKIQSQTAFKSKNKRNDKSNHNISQDNIILTDEHHEYHPHHKYSSSITTLQDHQNLKKPPVVKLKHPHQNSISTKDLDKTPTTFRPEKVNFTPLLISKSTTATNYEEHLSPKHPNSNPLSPKISPYTKVNENKNILHKLGDISPNDSINKNLFSQFLKKTDVSNFINPNFKSTEKLDLIEKQFNQIKNNSNTSSKKGNSTSHRGPVSNYSTHLNQRELWSNELSDHNYRHKLDFKEDSDNSNQNSNYRSKMNNNNGSYVLYDVNVNIQPKDGAEFRESGQEFDIIADRVHKSTSYEGFGKASKNIPVNFSNSKMNYKPEKAENEISIRKSVPEFSTKSINASSSTQNINNKKDIGLQSISSSTLLIKTDDKLKNATDKSQMMHTILDLKNKVHEKELEILELKNSKLKYDMENQTLLHQMKDTMGENKKCEELIDKMKQTHINQEKEIENLKVKI